MRLTLATLVVLGLVAHQRPVAAQLDQLTVGVYHGKTLEILEVARSDGGRRQQGGTITSFYGKRGSQICVNIENANPVYYSYSLGKQSLSAVGLPDLSSLEQMLASTIPGASFTSLVQSTQKSAADTQKEVKQAGGAAEKKSAGVVNLTAAANAAAQNVLAATKATTAAQLLDTLVQLYNKSTTSLQADIRTAIDILQRSDYPETRAELATPGIATVGYEWAIRAARALDGTSGRFNDGNLSASLASVSKHLGDSLKIDANDPAATFVTNAITARNGVLVHARDDVQAVFATTVGRLCDTVGAAPSRFVLKVSKRDSVNAKVRAVRDSIAILAYPVYDRPALEVSPIGVAVYASHVPKFGVTNGKITESLADDFTFRGGAQLTVNLKTT
jgi:hypothetical protein